jgi:hypothetical protein
MIQKNTRQALKDTAHFMENLEWELKVSAPNYDPTPQSMLRIRDYFKNAKNQLEQAIIFYAAEVVEREQAEKAEIQRKKDEAYQIQQEADHKEWIEGLARVLQVIEERK